MALCDIFYMLFLFSSVLNLLMNRKFLSGTLVFILFLLAGCSFLSLNKNISNAPNNSISSKLANQISSIPDNQTELQNPEKPERLDGTICNSVIKGYNHADYERINIIFVGFNMPKEDLISFLSKYTDYDSAGLSIKIQEKHKITTEEGTELYTENITKIFYGLLGTEPFKSNKNKFNFWYVDQIQNMSESSPSKKTNKTNSNFCNSYCVSDIEGACGLKNIYPIYLCNASCRSYGSWATNKAYIHEVYSKGRKFNPYSIKTLIHELGHSFGGLRDEYTQINGTSAPGYPNCAPSLEKAQEWWGDLVGQGEAQLKVGYFKGCSYNNSNYRPTNSSIMRGSVVDLDYGPVNERRLSERLAEYSGNYSTNITEKDSLPQRNQRTKN